MASILITLVKESLLLLLIGVCCSCMLLSLQERCLLLLVHETLWVMVHGHSLLGHLLLVRMHHPGSGGGSLLLLREGETPVVDRWQKARCLGSYPCDTSGLMWQVRRVHALRASSLHRRVQGGEILGSGWVAWMTDHVRCEVGLSSFAEGLHGIHTSHAP